MTTMTRAVNGNQWVAPDDHATTQTAMKSLCAVLHGVSAADLLRHQQLIATSRTQSRAAATGNFEVRSVLCLRRLSVNSVRRS